MENISTEFLLLSLVFLLMLSGFFSSSETGMMALNRYRLKHMAKHNKGARKAQKLLERPDRLISLILFGNNLVNILASSIAAIIAIRMFGESAVFAAGLILTFFVLIFAEVMPKTMAALHPEKIAFTFSHVLTPLMKLLSPFVWVTNKMANTLLKAFKVDINSQGNEMLSAEELRTIVLESGNRLPTRQNMLLNILDLEKVTVSNIMIPRSDVVGIDLTDDDATIIEQIQTSSYTRIPVYRAHLDNIVGILHLRNTTQFLQADGTLNRAKLRQSADAPYFIPDTSLLHTQLIQFQKEQAHMAVIVDEYGSLTGIVTLEDILEEIVGEFTQDAHNEEDYFENKDGSYTVQGWASIRDLNRELEWSLPTNGPNTLNGLVLEYLETFPDGHVCIQIDNHFIETKEMDDNLIQELKVHVIESTNNK